MITEYESMKVHVKSAQSQPREKKLSADQKRQLWQEQNEVIEHYSFECNKQRFDDKVAVLNEKIRVAEIEHKIHNSEIS